MFRLQSTEISNVIKINYPSSELLQKADKELTFNNPEYIKRIRLEIPLWDTPRFIRLYSYSNNTLTIPYGSFDKFRNLLPADGLKINLNNNGKREYKSSIKLRDYQEEAVKSVLESSSPSGVIVMPAGSGKTITALELAARLGKTCLWITHTIDLLNQSLNRAREYFDLPKSSFGKITNGKVEIGEHISFATVQTLNNSDLESYADKFDVVIVDECHNVAVSAKQLGMFQRVIEMIPAKRKIGLTATAHRGDGLFGGVLAILGDIYIKLDKDVIGEHIVPVYIKKIDTEYIITDNFNILDSSGKIHYAKLLNDLSTNYERNSLIVEHLLKNKNEYTLVLSRRIEHLEEIREMLVKNVDKEKIRLITGDTQKAEREESLELMRQGKINYLFATYQLAQEGLDIPRLSRLFMAQPIKDKRGVIQSIGRIERSFKNKKFGICYDFIDRNVQMLLRQSYARNRVYKSEGYNEYGYLQKSL